MSKRKIENLRCLPFEVVLPINVGECVVFRVIGGRRPPRGRPPGEGKGGAWPVVRIEIDGPGWVLLEFADVD